MKKIQRINYDSCPLCNSDNLVVEVRANCSNHPLYSPKLPEIISWLRCQQCDHSFTDGYFGADGFEELTKKSNDSQVLSLKHAEQWRLICSHIITNISNIRDSYTGRWLDIGFGNGALLLTAQEFGYKVTGIDLRNSSIEGLKPYIEDVRFQDFFDVDEYGQYDVVSMADVLEHVPFPKTFLAHAYKLLKPSGLVFISLPNISAPIWKILNNHNANPYWGEIEHFHNFSRERLVSLLEDYDFEYCYYGVSERYRACMEVAAKKVSRQTQAQ